jgi:hypothetical protein
MTQELAKSAFNPLYVLDWAEAWLTDPTTPPPPGVEAQITTAVLATVVTNQARLRGVEGFDPADVDTTAELCAVAIANAAFGLTHQHGQAFNVPQTIIGLLTPICAAVPETIKELAAILHVLREAIAAYDAQGADRP